MAAGDSAEEEARRLRERARRLEERADNFERGADGERRIAEVLARLPNDYLVFHDLRLPAPSKANVDHVVVGPQRVTVIDTKNFANPVTVGTGRGSGKLWTGRKPIASLETCAWEASAVSEIVGVPVEPVMCIIAPSLPSSAFRFGDVHVCSPGRLLEQLMAPSGDSIDQTYVSEVIGRVFGVAPSRPAEHGDGVAAIGGQTLPSAQPVVRRVRSVRRRRGRPLLPRLIDSTLIRVALVCAAAVAGLALLPTIMDAVTDAGESAGQHLAETVLPTIPPNPTTTTATAPPSPSPPARSAAAAECGQIPTSWLVVFEWPGSLPDGASGYAVSWQLDGESPVSATSSTWTHQDAAPTRVRVANDELVIVTTAYVDDEGTSLAARTDQFERPVTCPTDS